MMNPAQYAKRFMSSLSSQLEVSSTNSQVQSTMTIRQCKNNDYGLFYEYGQSEKILNNFRAASFDFLVR